MTETPRIRWNAGAEASITAWSGEVGTLDPYAFEIIEPVFSGDQHTLTSHLPGQLRWKLGGDPEALKKAAEAWLEEFISSLGATFPEQPAPRRRRCGSELDEDCPRPVAWLWWPDGRDGPGGSVYLCDEHAANIDLPELEDLADQTPASRAAGEKE